MIITKIAITSFEFPQDSVFLAGEEGAGHEVLHHRWTIITEALGQVHTTKDLVPAVSKYAEDEQSFEGISQH